MSGPFQGMDWAWTFDCIKAQAKTAEMSTGTVRRRETRRFAKQNLFFIGFLGFKTPKTCLTNRQARFHKRYRKSTAVILWGVSVSPPIPIPPLKFRRALRHLSQAASSAAPVVWTAGTKAQPLRSTAKEASMPPATVSPQKSGAPNRNIEAPACPEMKAQKEPAA